MLITAWINGSIADANEKVASYSLILECIHGTFRSNSFWIISKKENLQVTKLKSLFD